mgnify:CR=1 FL=1
MKNFLQEEIKLQLEAEIREQIELVSRLRLADPAKLLQQPAPGKWSIIQVLEHLNSYGYFYIPEIEKAILRAKAGRGVYKPGWLGNYFVNLMAVNEQEVPKKKMKAASRHEPQFLADSKPVIDRFLQQQQQLLDLLQKASDADWGSSKTKISVSSFIKMKLGDTLRFVVAHQQRHMYQIKRQWPVAEPAYAR